MPKSLYFKQERKVSYITKLFEKFEKILSNQAIVDKAVSLSSSYGLNAIDALHAASAIEGKADELVTFDKNTKPFFRIPSSEIRIVSLNG
jgi:predicted nucleic acid-binding protein